MVRTTCRLSLIATLWGSGLLLFALPVVLSAVEEKAEQPPAADEAQEIGDPWDIEGPPRPFVPTCFDYDYGESGGLTQADATRWLRAADSHPLDISETKSNDGCAVTIKGVARLRAPWVSDSVLRLSLYSSKTFELHFWAQSEGIMLQAYPSGHRQQWAAYRTSRPPSGKIAIGGDWHRAADPGLALLATDGRRGGRTYSGTVEIRHQNGALVMTHGDVRLLTVPLEAPPTEVYLEGQELLLRQIAMFRGETVPEGPRHTRTDVVQGDRPARLRWHENMPSTAGLEKLRDGLTTLVAKDTEELAWACVPLLRAGLYEVVFKLEDPLPGTGIYLGQGDGQPVLGIGFFRDPQNGRTFFGYDEPAAAAAATTIDKNKAPAPYVGRRHWLRLVLANGTLKCWTSGDGTHWGQALPPLSDVPSGCSHVGLYCRPGPGTRSIGLRRLHVRRLDAVTSLAPTALRERAESLLPILLPDPATDMVTWRQRVWEHQPAGVDAAAWRRACAVATLHGGCPSSLGNLLIDGLLDDALSLPGLEYSHAEILQDAALLYDTWSTADATRFVGHVQQWGATSLSSGDGAGFREVRRQLMDLPVWTEAHRVDPLPGDLAAGELVALSSRQKWPEAHLVCQQLRFFHEPTKPAKSKLASLSQLNKWVNWADGLASGRLARRTGDAAAMPSDWRHPFIVQLDKEAYNLHAELLAALREEDYRSASQILISGTAGHDWGLLVDPEDERLVTSLPTACLLLMRRHPPLSASMQNELDRADLSRLRRALIQADVPAVQAATVRYFGTPVAAEANAWLGDRLFAEGRIARAVGCYEQALSSASDDHRQQLTARVRLAQAMLGVDAGEPVMESVQFGQLEMTAEQFERLVAEMRETHGTVDATSELATRADPAPAASAREPRPWSKLDRVTGPDLSQMSPAARPADWLARQVTTTLAGDLLLVADRCRVVAYELATGKVKWSYPPAEPTAQDAMWSMVPMRPKVSGGRVALRLLTADGQPELVCLDRKTGQLLWSSGQAGAVVSDPVWMNEELMALTLGPSARSIISRMMLTFFSPDSGAVLSDKPLVECRGLNAPLQSCQVTVIDDNIVGAGLGTIFCCDTLGQLRWVRRETWIPPSLDPGFMRQRYEPPLVAGRRVFVSQPGMRCVVCAELDSGRSLWRRPVFDLRRLVGLYEEMLLIETDNGLRAVHAETGQPAWDHPVAQMLACYPHVGPDGLLYVRNDAVAEKRLCPTLVWLDPESGRTNATCAMWDLIGEQPVVGPVSVLDDRLWCFTGMFDDQGKLAPEKNIVELITAGPPTSVDSGVPGLWPSDRNELQAAAAVVLPGWRVLSAPHDGNTGLQAELAGRKRVFVTKADATPTRIARQVQIPADGSPRLQFEIGHAPDTKSKLQVRAAGIPIHQVTPGPTAAAGEWQQLEVDLSNWSGRDVWITITQERIGTAPAYMYWRRAEVVP